MNTNCTTATQKDEQSFITIELRGGPYSGQSMRVPKDEFFLQLSDRGKPVSYSRFNNAPVFHHEDAIVALLSGGNR